ncbi:MAG: hypothetical protein LBE56_12425 [Tannerella sp.]|nr:hypothetical protein [Tannerella sp.]
MKGLVPGFPNVREGDYLRFHYHEQAQYGGLYNDFKGNQHAIEISSRTKGKAISVNQFIITPLGERKWGDLQIGDEVFNEKGGVSIIRDIPYEGYDDMYEIMLKDGRTVLSSKEHLWNVIDRNGIAKTVSLAEIMKDYRENVYSIPNHQGVEYPEREDISDPYLYGQLFRSWRYLVTNTERTFPEKLKYSSREQRLEFLKGLFDWNGKVNDSGNPEYRAFFLPLIEDIAWLCRSLGFNCSYRYNNEYYTLTVFANEYLFKEKYLSSLQDLKPKELYATEIVDIAYLYKEQCKCITVDGGTYLVGDFVQSHNSYSMAARLLRDYQLGPIKELTKNNEIAVVAYMEDYLTNDGFMDKIRFAFNELKQIYEETGTPQFPFRESRNTMTKLRFELEKVNNGLKGLIAGMTTDKGRGRRNIAIAVEEFGAFPESIQFLDTVRANVEIDRTVIGLIMAAGCLTEGNMVYTKEGQLIDIKDVSDTIVGYDEKSYQATVEPVTYKQPEVYKPCIRITTRYGEWIECSEDHPLLVLEMEHKNVGKSETTIWTEKWIEAKDVDIKKHRLLSLKTINMWGDYKIDDPYMAGQECKLPEQYMEMKWVCSMSFLAGLYDTYGNFKGQTLTLTHTDRDFLQKIKFILRKLGIISRIIKEKNIAAHFLKIDYYDGIFLFLENVPVKISSMRDSMIDYIRFNKSSRKKIKQLNGKTLKENYIHYRNKYIEQIVKIVNTGVKRVYNLTADKTHTYLANNLITHNTGGSKHTSFFGAMELINNPESRNFYGLPNIYDKGSTGASRTVFFYPTYLCAEGYYNKDGVTDIIGSMLEVLSVRHKIKFTSSDPSALTSYMAEYPFTIQEAIIRKETAIYPVITINDRILELDNHRELTSGMYIGELKMQNSKVQFEPNHDLYPILQFPHKDNKLKGAVYISEMPQKDSTGNVPRGRYVSGFDPTDTDGASTLSLNACYVLDLWTDRLVAEYVGREDFTEDSFEIVRKLLFFYNAECLYENNKKGLFSYFSKMNCLYLLSPTPDFLKDKSVNRPTYGNSYYGVTATQPNKAYGRRALRDYLLKPVEIEQVNEITHETETVTVPMVQTIKFRALLQELALYNPDGNFDRHDAMIWLMVLREDKLRLQMDRQRYSEEDITGLGQDQFFTRNYENASQNKRNGHFVSTWESIREVDEEDLRVIEFSL